METLLPHLSVNFWTNLVVLSAVATFLWRTGKLSFLSPGAWAFEPETGPEREAFLAASRELRLDVAKGKGAGIQQIIAPRNCWISGRLGGVEVEVQGHNGRPNTPQALLAGARGPRRTRIVVSRVPGNLTIRRAGSFAQTHPYPLVALAAVPTGDPAFDGGPVYVVGPPLEVAMSMTSAARAALLEVVPQYGAEVYNGELWIDVPGGQRDPAWIVNTVRAACRAAQAMQDGANAGAAGLAGTTDPVPGVRLVAFKHLETLDPAAAKRIAAGLLSASEADLRLLAPRRDGTATLDVIRALASPELEDRLVVEAIRSLLDLGGAGFEPLLLSRLGKPFWSPVTHAADIATIEVLGQIGTVHTIAALQALSPPLPLKPAVAAAIRDIRSRMPAVEGGWVSMVEGGGEVSVVEGEGDAGAEEGELVKSAGRQRLPEG